MERIILKAGEGMVLTDGKIFGRIIYLADSRNKDEFCEITKEEYEKITEGGESDGGEDTLD